MVWETKYSRVLPGTRTGKYRTNSCHKTAVFRRKGPFSTLFQERARTWRYMRRVRPDPALRMASDENNPNKYPRVRRKKPTGASEDLALHASRASRDPALRMASDENNPNKYPRVRRKKPTARERKQPLYNRHFSAKVAVMNLCQTATFGC
jgi:hypothetical protein